MQFSTTASSEARAARRGDVFLSARFRAFFILGAIAAVFTAGAAIKNDACAARQFRGIDIARQYVPTEGPMLVDLSVSQLLWMTPEGDVLDGPVNVRPGRVDLTAAFPALPSIQRTTYIQPLDDGMPSGPAFVVQPMLSPLYPVTETVMRPDGRSTTHIVGWSDQPRRFVRDDQPKVLVAEPDDDQDGGDSENGHDEAEDDEDQPEEVTEPREIVREVVALDELHLLRRDISGFCVYVERDALLRTSEGDIRIALRHDIAPNTAWHFRELVAGGLYDGVTFHRIVPYTAAGEPFIIQGGDPKGDGRGGPGFRLPLEPSTLKHDLGVVSMARGDHPDSAGSQFFIALSREGAARLDGQYASFGEVVSGLDAIRAIQDAELADVRRGRAVNPPVIHAAMLLDAPSRVPGKGRPDRRIRIEEPEVKPPPRRIPR